MSCEKTWNSRAGKNTTSNRNLTIAALALVLFSLQSFIDIGFAGEKHDTWTPELKFSIENKSYIESLIFVSGVSYALTSSDVELKRTARQNFYCLKDTSIVGSKLLIDIINEKHSGSITSEQAIETIIHELKKRYPCK